MIYLPVSKTQASRLARKFPDLVRTDAQTDGRRYTSVGVSEKRLKAVWAHQELNDALPWRYRQKPIQIQLFPTPEGVPTDALSRALSASSYQLLRDRVTRHFGGRCQVCGSAEQNHRSRRIAPRLFTTWLHTPHPDTKNRLGMREILGTASVCRRCLGPMTLADKIPCSYAEEEQRKEEVGRSIKLLAHHNRTTVDQALKVVSRRTEERRSHLDNRTWVLDCRWLIKSSLMRPDEIILSHTFIRDHYTLTKSCLIVPPQTTGTSRNLSQGTS